MRLPLAPTTVRDILVGILFVSVAGWAVWLGLNPPGDDAAGVNRSLARPPAAAPSVGVYTEATIMGDGTQSVTQWVLADSSLREIVLSLPRDAQSGNGVEIDDVQVDAAGYRATNTEGQLGEQPARYYLAVPARQVRIRYVRQGGVRTSSSRPDRALVAVTPLAIGPRAAVDGPSVIQVTGGELLSGSCTPARSAPRPCGEPTGDRWKVRLDAGQRDDRVGVQLNLP